MKIRMNTTNLRHDPHNDWIIYWTINNLKKKIKPIQLYKMHLRESVHLFAWPLSTSFSHFNSFFLIFGPNILISHNKYIMCSASHMLWVESSLEQVWEEIKDNRYMSEIWKQNSIFYQFSLSQIDRWKNELNIYWCTDLHPFTMHESQCTFDVAVGLTRCRQTLYPNNTGRPSQCVAVFIGNC